MSWQIICTGCDQPIEGKTAYKTDEWTPELPTQHLLCPACSTVLLEDRTGRQVRVGSIQVEITATEPTFTSVATEDVTVTVVVQEPEPASRTCSICEKAVPSDWPHPLHEDCYASTRVITDVEVNAEEAEKQIRKTRGFITKIKGHNDRLDLTEAENVYEQALMAYAVGKFLLAARKAWLAQNKAARIFSEPEHLRLLSGVEKLRRNGYPTTGRLDDLLIEVEGSLAEKRYIKASRLMLGNPGGSNPSARWKVAAAWQRPRTEAVINDVAEQIDRLRSLCVNGANDQAEERISVALAEYDDAKERKEKDPWTAADLAQQALQLLNPVIRELELLERQSFAQRMSLGGRARTIEKSSQALQELIQSEVTTTIGRALGPQPDPVEEKRVETIDEPEPYRGGRKEKREERGAAEQKAIVESLVVA